jgi:hypothetical protein
MRKYTAFRCPIDLLRRAKLVADAERRSLSNYIIWLLEQDLIRRTIRHHEPPKESQASQASERVYGSTDTA